MNDKANEIQDGLEVVAAASAALISRSARSPDGVPVAFY
jgi:hypothetical protein